jgi:4-aminobutyrate aminotransferase
VEREYVTNAVVRGAQLKAGLLNLQQNHRQIGEVRGLGLMVAMDLVKGGDPQVLDPAARDALIQSAFQRGLLLLGCGESAVRFCPPLCIAAKQVDTALKILDDVLKEMTDF